MKSFGSLLLFFGIGSIVLNFVGYELSLLMWIDMWGETAGWAIRGAMVVGGGAMWFLGGGFGGESAETEEYQEPETPHQADPEMPHQTEAE